MEMHGFHSCTPLFGIPFIDVVINSHKHIFSIVDFVVSRAILLRRAWSLILTENFPCE